jgi:hypothetical protein
VRESRNFDPRPPPLTRLADRLGELSVEGALAQPQPSMDKADEAKRQFRDAWAMYVDVRRDEFAVEAPLLVRNPLEISSTGCATVRVQAARREEVRSFCFVG